MVIALIGARGLLWTLILREGSLTALERRREGSLTTTRHHHIRAAFRLSATSGAVCANKQSSLDAGNRRCRHNSTE